MHTDTQRHTSSFLQATFCVSLDVEVWLNNSPTSLTPATVSHRTEAGRRGRGTLAEDKEPAASATSRLINTIIYCALREISQGGIKMNKKLQRGTKGERGDP